VCLCVDLEISEARLYKRTKIRPKEALVAPPFKLVGLSSSRIVLLDGGGWGMGRLEGVRRGVTG